MEKKSPGWSVDVDYMDNNSDALSKDGFVLLHCEINILGDYEVIAEVGILSGINKTNGHISLANLHDTYWTYGRSVLTGYMNGIEREFDSEYRKKELTPIKIKYCICDDDFDPDKLIKTDIGNGIFTGGELDPYLNTLLLNIRV